LQGHSPKHRRAETCGSAIDIQNVEIKLEVRIGTALRMLLLTVLGPDDGEGADPSNLSATT
jgi:hypothetical protein